MIEFEVIRHMQSRNPLSYALVDSCVIESIDAPFFTIAIPHYRHRKYLQIVLDSLVAQDYTQFEIVVSDDHSLDDSYTKIPSILRQSGIPFSYYYQRSNLGYDGNVRFCLSVARGRYVFLLGNDDALSSSKTLSDAATLLEQLGMPEIAFTNYEDWQTGTVVRRAQKTQVLGAGVPVAVKFFRSFSFVSGLIFDRAAAIRHETEQWDQSVYYQIFLASRILASGGMLGALNLSAVRKDVRVDDQTVANYITKWANTQRSFQWRHTGLDSVIRVTAAAVIPYISEPQQSGTIRKIVAQILLFSYLFWLFEYRRVATWSFAVGVARDLWPSSLLAEYKLRWHDRLYLWILYLIVTCFGLMLPRRLFDILRFWIADRVRHFQQTTATRGQ